VAIVVGFEWTACVVQVAASGDELLFSDGFGEIVPFILRHDRRLRTPRRTAHIVYKADGEILPCVAGALGVFESKYVLCNAVLEILLLCHSLLLFWHPRGAVKPIVLRRTKARGL